MSRVYLYVAVICILTCIAESAVSNTTVNALNDLFIATNGRSWITNTSWGIGDPCTDKWHGVVCDITGEHVIEIYLNKNGLTGSIPKSIGNLTQLKTLELVGNNLSGTIPSSFSSLVSLLELDLTFNYFNGSVDVITNLAQAEYLHLAHNRFSGSIPGKIGNCTALKILDLSVNQFSGGIPQGIFQLPSLSVLLLNNNQLSGTIATSLCEAPHTYSDLFLSENKLNGTIPSCIGNLTITHVLRLNDNNLSGTIPASIGSATMNELLLYNNNLSGSLPASIGNMTSLTILNLELNKITHIPDTICNLVNLQTFNFYQNEISGTFPGCISNLVNLKHMVGYTNHFTGTIPEAIGNLKNLVFLNFGNNNMTGTLPTSLCQLTTLTALHLDTNNFVGTIPSCIGNITTLDILKLEANYFSGRFPSFLATPPNYFVNITCNVFSPPFPSWCVTDTTCSPCEGKSVCGNGVLENFEECDPPSGCCSSVCFFKNTTEVCRPSAYACDAVEYCTGTNSNCPTDNFSRDGVLCASDTCSYGEFSLCMNGSCVCDECGNGICGSGEDCTTCSLDCPAPCGLCGDGLCQSSLGENCTICYVDCGWCPPESKECPQNCSDNGECKLGVCECYPKFSGAFCESVKEQIEVVVNNRTPEINIQPSYQIKQSFRIAFKNLEEIDIYGQVVKYLDLTTVNFTFTHNETDFGESWQFVSTRDLTLCGGVKINILLFKEQARIKFGNESFSYSLNDMKYSLEISRWPFQTVKNRLKINIQNSHQSVESYDECQVSTTVQQNGNFFLYKINVKGVTLFGKFINFALLDSRIQHIEFNTLNNYNSVELIVPSFFREAIIDPDFSILIEPSPDPTHNTNPNCRHESGVVWMYPTIAVILFVTAVAVIVAVVYVMKKNKKKKLMKRKFDERMMSMNSIQMVTMDTQN